MSYAKSQRGVALLMALGFLSLLLITGIAFVTNATIARKAAANANANAQAKTLANAAANRLLAAIRYTVAADPTDNFVTPINMTSVESPDAFSEDNDTNDLLRGENSLLTTWVYGEKYIPDTTHTTENTRPKWEFWYSKYSGADPDTGASIIGRTAFMSLPPTASVNFSEVLRGADFSTPTGTWSKWDARRGASMRELYLGTSVIANLYDRFKTEEFEDKAREQDFAKEGTRVENYPDYDSIFSAAGWDDSTDTDGKRRNWLRSWLLPGGYNDPEIFAFNNNGNNKNYDERTLFFHRFNLDRRLNNSDVSVWDSAAGGDRLTVNDLLGDPVRFVAKEVAPQPSKALPWLKIMTGDAASFDTDYTPEILRKQVAANLIDYSDNDSEVTSDSTNWETDEPSYTGHEKTPYINEIMVGVTATVTRTDIKKEEGTPPAVTTSYTASYSTDIALRNVTAELVNIYNGNDTGTETAFGKTAKLRILGSAVLKITPGDGASEKTVTLSFDTGSSGQTLTLTRDGNYAYATLDNSSLTSKVYDGEGVTGPELPTPIETAEFTLADPATAVKPKVELMKLTIDKAYLVYDDKKADYVRKLEQADLLTAEKEVTPVAFSGNSRDTEATVNLFAGFAVDDPRMNLYQRTGTVTHWNSLRLVDNEAAPGNVLIPADPDAETEEKRFTIGKKNSFCNPTASGTDAEDFKQLSFPDEAMFSTAFIANKPMVTLTELGVIHRGEKWRTINLKCSSARIWDAKYDPEKTDLTTAEGYTYTNGDAAILDQVKLTHECFTAGKVNLNRYPATLSENFLFKALFENIGYGILTPDQYKPADVTSRVSAGDAAALQNALGASGRTALLSRGHMVDFLKNRSEFIRGTTDVQKEVVPAVSSGLTGCYVSNPDIVQYIVVAQAIRDVGTTGSGFKMSKLDADGNAKEADVVLGKFDYKDKIYYDEIMGEVKLLVTVKIDSAHRTVRLLKTEFID